MGRCAVGSFIIIDYFPSYYMISQEPAKAQRLATKAADAC